MENAIIMAAGLGIRMFPLTRNMPKPLIKVHGKPMIETVIEALLRRRINKIVVVVGYLGEQFKYLKVKYPCVQILKNPYYNKVNNISSVFVARNILKEEDCFICEADLLISDPTIFDVELNNSCYFGKMVLKHSDDWVFDIDDAGYICRVGKVGDNCYNMVCVSYFTKSDATILAEAIEHAYKQPGYETQFWDDVVNNNLNRLKLSVHPIMPNQIIEIDTIDELKVVNGSYL